MTIPKDLFSADCAHQFKEFAASLIKENQSTNLTGAKTEEEFYLKHIVDAALAWKTLDASMPLLSRAEHHWDVGSGNGIPGIIVAILAEESRVTLVERREKKAAALSSVVSSLGLSDRVDVVCKTFEQIRPYPERSDTIWFRGFLPGPKLIEYLSQNFDPADLGPIILMKGQAWGDELVGAVRAKSASKDWKIKFSSCQNYKYEELEHLGQRLVVVLNS